MSWLAFLLVVLSETASGAGQVFFKRAMCEDRTVKSMLIWGIVVMAIGFFLWEGLLSKFDLSYLYPFDALKTILLMIAASVFLKEKMTLHLWVGASLICAGILLVSRS
jgi:drug/metabolite transporter (DMT)-like permease